MRYKTKVMKTEEEEAKERIDKLGLTPEDEAEILRILAKLKGKEETNESKG